MFFAFSINVSAQTVAKDTVNTEQELARVTSIGQKLLSSNNLPTKVTFIVSPEEDVNAYANIDNEVHVYIGLLKIVETDDELASVIAHEIGHLANRHIQKQSLLGVLANTVIANIKKPFVSKVASGVGSLSMLKVSRSAEYEADLTGADLMIGAGYNPEGMLSLLNKIAQNYIDVIQTHPSGNKRLENVYDYLSFNYPEKLQHNYNTDSYRKFKIYIDGVIKERNSNPKKMAEYTKKQTKLKNEKLKRAKTIKNESNAWASVYNVLQSTVKLSN
ncbi:MAG TPA: M48 family metallopeptidase [Candidatus Gastranaerophilales bacterium]|nr:M48 family metallopeptidase [Candidatus Gastranaerophilales bacterium]